MAITGAHVLLYSSKAEEVRAILRDVFAWHHVDAGQGWLIFKLPPTEMGVHSGDNGFHQIYFICDDVDAFVERMAERGVETEPVAQQSWGRSTGVTLPGGGTLGVYEAHHARP